MTLYQATNGTRPVPGTLSDSATGSILQAFMAGATFDGWKQTTTQEMKGAICPTQTGRG